MWRSEWHEVTHWQGSSKLPALGFQSLSRVTSSHKIRVLVLLSAGLRGSWLTFLLPSLGKVGGKKRRGMTGHVSLSWPENNLETGDAANEVVLLRQGHCSQPSTLASKEEDQTHSCLNLGVPTQAILVLDHVFQYYGCHWKILKMYLWKMIFPFSS